METLFTTHAWICSLGDSEIASSVINESEAEGEEARTFLEDVRVTFPEVCRFKHTADAFYLISHAGCYLGFDSQVSFEVIVVNLVSSLQSCLEV